MKFFGLIDFSAPVPLDPDRAVDLMNLVEDADKGLVDEDTTDSDISAARTTLERAGYQWCNKCGEFGHSCW